MCRCILVGANFCDMYLARRSSHPGPWGTRTSKPIAKCISQPNFASVNIIERFAPSIVNSNVWCMYKMFNVRIEFGLKKSDTYCMNKLPEKYVGDRL